jgi:glyoxylase-like metal-dependent hydrolase (beta-lactamase superfamily II)
MRGKQKKTMKFGNFEIYSIVENSFKIDGGAMYGVVPKIIWQKFNPPDQNNLVKLDINLLLIKTDGENILIDAGIGDALSERQKRIFGVDHSSVLENRLSELHLTPEDIHLVLLTHLHADHSGGVIKPDKDGKKLPRFPNARHVVQLEEWEEAMHPDERTSATYFTSNLKILEQEELLELVEGEDEVAKGIRLIKTGGHTPGHQAVLIEDKDDKILWPGDIIPSTYHLRIPYVASVDLFPRETMEQKRKFLQMCLNDGWSLAFDHDLKVKIGKLEKAGEEIKIRDIYS